MIKNIIQVSKNKQDQYVIDKILQKADGWSYINFTDKEIYDYFSKNKLKNFENIEKKFKEIKNGAHKADLFRYYYIYINGGLYLDSDLLIKKDVEEIIKNHEFISAIVEEQKSAFNGLIYAEKNNKIIYQCLKHIYEIDVDALNSDYQSICKFFYTSIKKYNKDYDIKTYNVYDVNDPANILNDDNEVIAIHYWKSKKIP
jgi:mannosyltransferase OCH1-like enzyme